MCTCGGVIIQTNYSNVCTSCGLENRSYDSNRYLPGYNQSHSILRYTSTYSRRYRFHSLLLKTIFYHSGPPQSDEIWSYLKKQNLKTVGDIQTALSKTRYKNKRYDCLGIFCAAFLPHLVPKERVSPDQIELSMKLFDSVLSRWKTTQVSRFWSYFWLLEQILKEVGAGFCLRTCKRLICKHRRAFYKEMLKRLGGLRPPKCGWDKKSFSEWVSRPRVPVSPKKNPPSTPDLNESSLRVRVEKLWGSSELFHERTCGADPGYGVRHPEDSNSSCLRPFPEIPFPRCSPNFLE